MGAYKKRFNSMLGPGSPITLTEVGAAAVEDPAKVAVDTRGNTEDESDKKIGIGWVIAIVLSILACCLVCMFICLVLTADYETDGYYAKYTISDDDISLNE